MSLASQFRVGPAHPATPRVLTAESTTHAHAGDINIVNIDLPSTLTAGNGYTATVTLNISTFSSGIAYSHEDHCAPSLFTTGFDVVMGGAIEGVPGVDFDQLCARAPSQAETELGREYETDFNVQIVAPEENGDYQAQFTATGGVSGNVMENAYVPVTVTGGVDPSPPGNGDDGDDDGGNGDDNGQVIIPGNGDNDDDGGNGVVDCSNISSVFTQNQCCPLNPSGSFRVPPYIGPEIDLEENAPNLCTWTPIGVVVLYLVVRLLIGLSPARIVGDVLGGD